MFFRRLIPFLLLSATYLCPIPFGHAQNGVSDPNYVLLAGDTIAVQVLEENDLSANVLIDKEGQVRLPLLGDVSLVGQALRTAEKAIEKAYIEHEILKSPQVRINVISYGARVFTVLGAVRSPGKTGFNRDALSIDITEAIGLAGGFTQVAKKDQVSIYRTGSDGKEEVFIIDVDAMISGKHSADKAREFPIRPGDRIVVKERVF